MNKTKLLPGNKANTVLVVSLALSFGIGGWGIVAPEQMTKVCLGITGYALESLDWFFLAMCTGFLILSAFLAFGPYGHLKLGADDEEPEFSTISWLAMLFAGGMGAGLVFWGAAEPMYHYYSPPGMTGLTPEAARAAMVITNLHWGLHAWSIYAVCALVIAYFGFRKHEPSLISTPIRHAFGKSGSRQVRFWCNTADVIGVLAVIFGLAGSLTMGVLQVRAGLSEVFGTPDTHLVSIIILTLMTAMFLLSASTGVDKGIKILSNINMVIAILILLVVIFFGPTVFILQTFINTIGDYFSQLLDISFRLFPYEGLSDWTQSWTLTYFIWWLAWGPFVGIFIARISRGRTIREFCIGVILLPTLFSLLWFAAFGGTGLYIEMYGGGGIAELIFEDVTKALFALLGYFPFSAVLNVLAVFLIFIFLVTSADSGTFVVSMMTSKGDLNPSTAIKLTWGVLIAVISTAVLFSGSAEVAKAMGITGAVPFSLILCLQIVAFLRTIRQEETVKTLHQDQAKVLLHKREALQREGAQS
jgi:glycine betaine transporter